MTINRRAATAAHRDLMRALGVEIRRLRSDAGRSQGQVARAAGIAPAHLSAIEAGDARPSIRILIAISVALGCDLSVRLFPNTGPRIRDRHQVAMGEALIALLDARWLVTPEVPVYRPIRGVIDLVLIDRAAHDTVATELQSQLRRIEQQARWAVQKADALAALPDQAGQRVGRLLVVRNTALMRGTVRDAERLLAAAYPSRVDDALASLAGRAAWPGPTLLWATIERGVARVLDRPPRGIAVGR